MCFEVFVLWCLMFRDVGSRVKVVGFGAQANGSLNNPADLKIPTKPW